MQKKSMIGKMELAASVDIFVSIQEELRPVLKRQSAQFASSHMEKLIQVSIQEQRNGLRPKRHMKRSGTVVI